jgi:hypothetical protein
VSNAQFLSVLEELCASSQVERWHLWGTEDTVRIVGKRECKNLEFRILKLVGEEPTPVIPGEIENSKNFLALLRSSRFSKESATYA